MSRIIRGPFTVKWGANTVEDIEELSLDTEVSRDDYETIQGKTYTIDGARKASVTITLLATDIPSLAALLPQYYVANGGILSTGETVTHADGAIDIASAISCDQEQTYNDLDIISCGNPADVTRLVNCRTSVEAVEVDSKIRKVQIMFLGEPEGDDASLQFFREGTIAVAS